MRTAGRWVPGTVPYFLSLTTFAAGVLLMFSGRDARRSCARCDGSTRSFRSAVIEVSHFAASIAGVILILLANGIRRRLDAAYHLTVLALVVGIAGRCSRALTTRRRSRSSSCSRPSFPRDPLFPSSRAHERAAYAGLDRGARRWCSPARSWLGLFSYGRGVFANDLWWRFATVADAPRFLRAMAGTTAVVVAFGAGAPASTGRRRAASLPAAEELARAKAVAKRCPDVRAHLALLGDKSLLFSDSGNAFIMYGVPGRSWVALGDPVGPAVRACRAGVARSASWRTATAAGRCSTRSSRDLLPLCIDLGLDAAEARRGGARAARHFSLDGGSRRGLRRTPPTSSASGPTFEMVPPERRRAAAARARRRSPTTWLAAKRTREKGFSLGFFDAEYLADCPTRARCAGTGEIVAFANVWTSEAKHRSSRSTSCDPRRTPRAA